MSDANKPTDQHIEQGLSEITTNEKASTYAQSDAGVAFRAENKKAEAKLVRKLDMIILPLATLLYLCKLELCASRSTAKVTDLLRVQLPTLTVVVSDTAFTSTRRCLLHV